MGMNGFTHFYLAFQEETVGKRRRSRSDAAEYDRSLIRVQGYIIFFMLNSVEHEILNARKYKKNRDIRLF